MVAAATPYFGQSIFSRIIPNRDMMMFPLWAHPDVRYWAPTWLVIRDCLLGEQEIKAKERTYLPALAEMDTQEYECFKDRAVFYNMTCRTVEAQVGTLFQRPPKVANLPKPMAPRFSKVVYNGISFQAFVAAAAEALIAMGRYGVLVDMDASGKYDPYLRGYDTENILDWQYDEVNGRRQPVQIILREFQEIVNRKVGEMRWYKVIHRVLSLDIDFDPATGEQRPVYRQYIYEGDGIHDDLTTLTPTIVTPTHRGTPFDYIPFQFLGSKANTPDVDRPPCADIASLNLAHYKSYALLEHGRFFTAIPIYYVQVNAAMEKAEYTIGPSRVWETAQGEKPGILEFHGSGLKTLENSCQQKENQIAAIGGRLLGGGAGGAPAGSESDNQAKIKESNERALLQKICQNLAEGLTNALNWWATWCDVQNPTIEVDMNSDFLFNQLGARELRAAQQMYMDGVIPATALHNYLLKAEVLPDWMDVEDFKKLLDDMNEFPNQSDVWARRMGYANAQNYQDVLLARKGLKIQEAGQATQQQLADTTHEEMTGTLDIQQQQVDVAKKAASSRPLPGQVSAGRASAAASKPNTAKA